MDTQSKIQTINRNPTSEPTNYCYPTSKTSNLSPFIFLVSFLHKHSWFALRVFIISLWRSWCIDCPTSIIFLVSHFYIENFFLVHCFSVLLAALHAEVNRVVGVGKYVFCARFGVIPLFTFPRSGVGQSMHSAHAFYALASLSIEILGGSRR